jgi:uncharacterized membrane protein YvbJ
MFCDKCGTEASDDSEFCRKCGQIAGAHCVRCGGGMNRIAGHKGRCVRLRRISVFGALAAYGSDLMNSAARVTYAGSTHRVGLR